MTAVNNLLFGRSGRISSLCCGHPLERRQAANVVDEVLQADLKARPDNSDDAQ